MNKILDAAWEKREGFLFHPEPLSVQVARAKSLDGGPIVMADHGDNTASGGTQDVMSVIEEAMKPGLEVLAGPICDPAAVEQMIKAGVGAEVTLELGGKIDMPAMGLKGKPLKVTGKVKAITDGQFVVTGPMATGTRRAWAGRPCSTPARCRSWSPSGAPSPTTSASSPIAASIRAARSTC